MGKHIMWIHRKVLLSFKQNKTQLNNVYRMKHTFVSLSFRSLNLNPEVICVKLTDKAIILQSNYVFVYMELIVFRQQCARDRPGY